MSAPSSVTATPSLTSLLRISGKGQARKKNVMMIKLFGCPFPLFVFLLSVERVKALETIRLLAK
jgi:hypothetical protein